MNKGQRCKENYSCVGYCGKSVKYAKNHVCGCDQSCLYLGDCCFDYLYHCRNHSDLNVALRMQGYFRKRFKNKTKCTSIDVIISRSEEVFEFSHIVIPLVARCPRKADPDISDKCVQNSTFPLLQPILVHRRGVIYANIHCAICNGVRTGEAKALERDIINVPIDELAKRNSLSTEKQGNLRFVYHMPGIYESLQQRAKVLCAHQRCGKDDGDCLDNQFKEECMAYNAPYTVTGDDIAIERYRNEACFHCVHVTSNSSSPKCAPSILCLAVGSSSLIALHRWTTLFDFTGRKFGYIDDRHVSTAGNLPSCSEPICQKDYVLINGSCLQCIGKTPDSLTFVKAESCLLLLVFRSDNPVENFKRHKHNNLDISLSMNCSMLLNGLRNIKPLYSSHRRGMGSSIRNVPCILLSLPYMGVRDYIDALGSVDIVREIIPGIPYPFYAAFLLNFDPKFGITCGKGDVVSTEIRAIELRNGLEVFMQDVEQFPFDNNHTPVVLEMTITKPQEAMKLWKISCLENKLEFNCTSLASNSISNCPKIEVPFIMNGKNSSVSINSQALSPSEYLVTGNKTILICQKRCKIMQSNMRVKVPALAIVTSVCYSISILGLLVTFLIYLRTPSLRTIPGLMLMNLMLALLFAQAGYIMSSFGLFLDNTVGCQLLGATQHYFWLTSFAWMACISFDVFRCLQCSQLLATASPKARYYKMAFSCWCVPILLPVSTICLDVLGIVHVGYGGRHVCWLINYQSVLYLFAIPVLTIVLFNAVMFLACVKTIRDISNNAAYVGRQVDGKERLMQCVKISSLMGLSWLFGILPNIVDKPELWYVFTLCNAFQGVHIFVAFGLSRRVRQWLCGKKPSASDLSTGNATAHQSTEGETSYM